ncbi:MAG: Hint domain-containing protein [Planktomarina sp.]
MTYLEKVTPTSAGIPQRKFHRLYNVSYLAANGDQKQLERKLPARPAFEKACAAFGRGTLIDTVDGPEAIEDLQPSMWVKTPIGQARITWIGSTVMIPDLHASSESALTQLIRVQTSILSQSEYGDLVLGPLARIARPLPDAMDGQAFRYMDPYAAFGDGAVFPITPSSPVRMFQIMLEGACVVCTQGLAVETLNPGHLKEFATAEDWPLLAQLFASAPAPQSVAATA